MGERAVKLRGQLSRHGAGYVLLGILTLFVVKMDSYFNMEEYKCAAFAGITLFGGAAFLIGLPRAEGLRRWRWDGPAVWSLLLVLSLLTSQLLGSEGRNGWWGGNAYYMGTFFMLAALFVYTVIRMGTGKQLTRWALRLFLGAGFFSNLLGIVNQYGWDPLGQISRLIEAQRGVYFTTIGQMDFVSLMLTMWLSLAVAGFVCSEERAMSPENLFRLACAFFGFWGMMLFNSDGYLLGMLAALAALMCMKGFDTRKAQRLSVAGVLFWSAAWLGVRLTALWPTAQHLPMTAKAGEWRIALPGVVISVVLWLFLAKFHRKQEPIALHRYSRILWGCVLVLAACAVVLASTLFVDVKLTGGLRHLRFNEKWGTHRGACWIALWRIFRRGGALRWLFGWGMASTHTQIAAHMFDWSDIEYDIFGFYAAHNEYLEQLIAGGAFGLLAWLGFVCANLRRGFQKAAQNPTAAALTVSAAAYLAEASINIRTCIVFPVFIALLGLLAAETDSEQPKEPDGKALGKELAVLLALLLVTGFLWQAVGNVIIPFDALS